MSKPFLIFVVVMAALVLLTVTVVTDNSVCGAKNALVVSNHVFPEDSPHEDAAEAKKANKKD
eukprot:5798278-Ditylum_brightwellii.AAC.1